MPKIKGPLFSISATGSVGPVLCFRATKRGAQAQRAPVPQAAPSPAQLAERARVKDASASWRILDATTKGEWLALATARSKNPWILFCSEYLIQQCSGATLPELPAAPFGG